LVQSWFFLAALTLTYYIMKAKIIQSGYYNGNAKKLVCLCSERDILTFSHVVRSNDEKLCFKVKRGFPWNDQFPLSVYLRFEDYVAI
jgi:hypothetical protein